MNEEISYHTRLYTDIQGLKQLQYSKDEVATKKEVAQQFEGLMVQLMLRSMRDATNAINSGLFSNEQMKIYESLLDNQLSLLMSHSNLGFAKVIEKNIDQMTKQQHLPDKTYSLSLPSKSLRLEETNKIEQINFSSKEDFIKTLWSGAKKAAYYIGTVPEILLAQAALETNWGKKILPQTQQGGSTYNLFNIKADASWEKQTTMIDTIEQKDGILKKERAKFRSYESFKEGFMDYVNFLKSNSRYSEALKKAANPKEFIHALQNAGFATDPIYAEKILKIFSSQTFQNLIMKVKNI